MRRRIAVLSLIASLLISCTAQTQSQFVSPQPRPRSISPLLSPPKVQKDYLPLVFFETFEEQVFANLLTGSEQTRLTLTLNPLLSACARNKARLMAEKNWFGHTDPTGWGPNHYARECGYPLHDSYPNGGSNQIESIAGGYATAQDAWSAFMQSKPHRTHLLGLHPFFHEQTEYGIGYWYDPNSVYRHYYVIWITLPVGVGGAEVHNIQELHSIIRGPSR